MKLYKQNIIIDGNAQSTIDGQTFTPDPGQAAWYELYVSNVLDVILNQTVTGQVLLREIMDNPMNLRIIPYPKADARTLPKDPLAASPFGKQLRFPGDDRSTPQIERAGQPRLDSQGKPVTGSGGGSNVTILYHPLTWIMETLRTGHMGTLLPDDVLVHELVHGLRMMEGLIDTEAMEDASQTNRFGNTEEFYALLIANIYVSEMNKTQGRGQKLRGNISAPNQFVALTADEANSAAFYAAHKALIDRLCREMIGLCHGGGQKGVMHAPADFNPIRDSENAQEDLRLRMYGGAWMTAIP